MLEKKTAAQTVSTYRANLKKSRRLRQGIAVLWGLAMMAGTSFAQTGQVVVGATAAGVPTTPYARPDDSTSGVTQAVGPIVNTSCAAGLVYSGGSCVALPAAPTLPTCSYGQVWSGGQCVTVQTLNPPTTACSTGFVLSGGVCVALPAPTTPTCGTQPETNQLLPCAAGQTGSIGQSRSGTCNAATGYSWSMSAWSTTSNTCTTAVVIPPSTPSCPSQPSTTQTVSCPSGQTGAITQARSGTCDASTGYAWVMGAWFQSGSSCTTPAPAACDAIPSYSDAWGAGCTFTGPVASTAAGANVSVPNQRSGYTGSNNYRCVSGPANWAALGGTCNATPPPPPPTGCPSRTMSWGSGFGVVCYSAVPAGSQAQVLNLSGSSGPGSTGWGVYGGAQVQCLNGAWQVLASDCNGNW